MVVLLLLRARGAACAVRLITCPEVLYNSSRTVLVQRAVCIPVVSVTVSLFLDVAAALSFSFAFHFTGNRPTAWGQAPF